MNVIPLRDDPAPIETLERLVARYGLRRVLLALARLALRPRPRAPRDYPGALSDHMRRDIGLPPAPPPGPRLPW
jgi:hypothetical protein